MSTPPSSRRPSSIGAKPRSVHSSATVALAAESLLDTNTTRFPNSRGRFSASCPAAVWLNDLTTAAPGKASALKSVDRLPPRICSELGTKNAFVASTTMSPTQLTDLEERDGQDDHVRIQGRVEGGRCDRGRQFGDIDRLRAARIGKQ